MGAKNKSNEINIIRIYDAPIKLVWDAWTDPKKVAKWWGPRGFTITTHSKDLKPGGHWAYTMHGPDGTNWENKTIYHEVEKYSKLVYDHGGNDDRPPLFRVTVLFSESNGKTTMDMTMTLETPEAAEQTRKFIKQASGNSTWDRLAEYLSDEIEHKERFVINRTFATDIHTMFEMWTKPEHFAKWLAPTGFSMEYIRSGIKVGSTTFSMMSNGDIKMYNQIKYLDIKKPDRIIYTTAFVDEKENPSHHPALPVWPKTMLTTVLLAEEGPELTRVTVTWEPQNPTAEELSVFIQHKPSMTMGWTGSFDKLEDLLTEN